MNDAHAQSAANTPAIATGSLPVAARCECPRCGYDLSGVVAAWNHAESASCPMRGTCSECGLEFAWGEVLNPEISVPAWSFEHARSQHMFRLVRTILLCFRPWRLWRQLQMQHTVNIARLVVIVLVGVPVAHLTLTPLRFACLAVSTHHPGVPGAAAWLLDVFNASWPYGDGLEWYSISQGDIVARDLISFDSVWGAIWWSIIPLMFVLVPATLRSCHVRPAHVIRIGAYWLVFAALALPFAARLHVIIQDVLDPIDAFLSKHDVIPPYWGSNFMYHLYRARLWQQPLCLWALAFMYWGYALRYYLRLPRARIVAGVLVLIAGLIAFFVAYVVAYFVRGGMIERFFMDSV